MSKCISKEDHENVMRIKYVLISLFSICTFRKIPLIEKSKHDLYTNLMKLKIVDL